MSRTFWLCSLFLAIAVGRAAADTAAAPTAPAVPDSITVDGRTYVVVGQCPEQNYSIRLPLAPLPGEDNVRGLSVLFGARPGEDGGCGAYRLDADARGWELSSMDSKGKQTLARGRTSPFPAPGPKTLLIKRRNWLLTVALDERVLAEVADGGHFDGFVAVDPTMSAPGGEPSFQTVAKLVFEDGFMRPQDNLSLDHWVVETGQWRLHSVREDVDDMNLQGLPAERQPQSELSANPFCMSAHAEQSGLLTTGYWFWDDYEATVSVRDSGVKAAGLAFNVASPTDYFLVRWENDTAVVRPTRVQLLRVAGGKSTELASAWVNGQRDQWYSLGVRTCGERIQALLDRAVIMDLHSEESLGGEIGLYVEGGDAMHEASFDDVAVRAISGYDYDDETWLTARATLREGQWEARRVERPARPADFAAVLRSGDGRLVLGNGGWQPPLVSARVSAPAPGQRIGFEVGLNGPAGAPYRVTLGRDGDGPRLAVSQSGAGGEQELAACRDFVLPRDGAVELAADLTRPGELNVYLDGFLRLHLVRGDTGGGAVAFLAGHFPGATFQDARVAFERAEDLERPPAEKVFQDDPFMKHWSSPQGAWWPVQGRADAWWHVGDFYGRSEVTIPFDPRVIFVHSASDVSRDGGYALVQEKTQDGFTLRLLRNGLEAASATVSPKGGEQPKFVLYKETPYLWVTVDGREALSFRDPNPLPGTKAALSGLKAEDLGKLQLRRYQVKDEYFEGAPSDWYQVGTWKVTTRFSCDPRWSFMAALASQSCALFNKFRYEGDVTLEAYMGTRMGTAQFAGRYWRIGDFNFALCRRPFDLGDACNFIVAGWDPFWSDRNTYLLKGGRQLALTTERLLPNVRRENTQDRVVPVPWISGGRDVHGAWYYIKARKQGAELSSYVDNRQAWTYEDPEPLSEFDPAIWTYDTQIVVGRVKISYQKKVIPGRLVAAPPADTNVRLPEVPAPIIVSDSHPGFFDDFEGGERGWSTYPGQQSATLRIARKGPGSRQQCLEVANPGTGGLMEAIAPVADARIPAGAARLLSFDYRIPSDVKINLFLKLPGQYYYLHMTGPDQADAFFRRLGELPVQADGRWHHGEFPLATAIRNAGVDPKARLELVAFGNLHHGLLQAGMGGNGLGAAYWLDDFAIASGGPGEFSAACRGSDVNAKDVVLSAIDALPATVPAQPDPMEAKAIGPGVWVCHARVQKEGGALSGVAHLPFVVLGGPLQVSSADPAPGASWGYGPVEFQFNGPNAPYLDPASLKLTANGRPVASTPGLFEMDWVRNRLRVNLQSADVAVAPGQPCAISLAYADEYGHPGEFSANYTASLADDRVPPSAVALSDYLPPCDFEHDLGTWEGNRDTAVLRDDGTAASGKWSLRVENLRWANTFVAWALRTDFSAGLYPLAEFDYRIHDGVQVDLASSNARGFATIGLSDKAHYGFYAGDLPDFQQDGAWHHTEVNLLAAIRKIPYARDVFRQGWMAFGDFGDYRADAVGGYYNLDNFRLVPVVSGLKELVLHWNAHDASGIEGYSYLWSASAEDSPGEAVSTTENGGTFRDLPAPDAYLHIKACDAAGNWGPVSHFRFRVDSSAPQFEGISPAGGARAAASEISLTARDDSAVDPDSLTLTIDGRAYQPHSRGVEYNSETGRLVWNWLRCRPADQRSIPNGGVVQMELSARDFAGNAAPPCRYQWVMDYSLDKEPPTAPALASTTMSINQLDDFEEGTGQWRNARNNESGAQVRQVWRDEANGDHCLELFAPQQNSFFDAIASQQDYDLGAFPLVSFDYLMPEPVKVNMQVRINRVWFDVQMTAPRAANRSIGELPDIVADNAWHHASLDLFELARKALPEARGYTVNSIVFGDAARNDNRRNTRWFVDNFMVSSYGKPDAECQWRSEDVTGVPGYSIVLDRQMATAPAHQVNVQAESMRLTAAEPGTYWLHVAACDSNGNWSQPRHLAYTIAKPTPAAQPTATEQPAPAANP